MREGWQQTDGTVTTVEEFQTRAGPSYRIAFNYKAGESWYGGTFTDQSSYAVGDTLPIEFDPAHPENNNWTERENHRRWFVIGLVLVLVAVGCLLFFFNIK